MGRSRILLKKNETFLRSFMFFAKERCVLCILFCSLEKNGKERNVPFKERNIPNEKERGAQPWKKCFHNFTHTLELDC